MWSFTAQPVLTAVLYLLGYGDLADQFDEGRTWRRMHRVSGEHRAAVAACIAQEHYPI
jgi:hypothetical protein